MEERIPVLCVGAAHWDMIARTRAPLPLGADVPGRVIRRPGGVALNVARALAALDCPVVLLSAIGRDVSGLELQAAMAESGVATLGLTRRRGPTDCYLAVEGPDGALHAAVADCDGLDEAGATILAPLRDGRVSVPGRPWDGPVVVDGNLSAAVLDELVGVHLARDAPLAIVPASPFKTARVAAVLARRPATLYLNRAEAETLCAASFCDSVAAATALLGRGIAEAVVTDGAAAATVASAEGVVSLMPPAVPILGVTGAGDTFVAAHLLARAEGADPETALRAALDASARHISREPI